MRKQIIILLSQNRLKEALNQIITYSDKARDWSISNDAENLQTSYNLMLQYTQEGMKDPNKGKVYNQLIRAAYELTDRIYTIENLFIPKNDYYRFMQNEVLAPSLSYPQLQLKLEAYTENMHTAPLLCTHPQKLEKKIELIKREHNDAIDELFNKIWVSHCWTDAEEKEIYELFHSPLIQSNTLSMMVSATTMSLLHIFDVRKFLFLIAAYAHEDAQINQRALVGISLTCYYHDERISMYPEAISQLKEISEDANFISEMHNVQIQLWQSARETQKVDKKMREEILPEMIKKSLEKSPKLGIDETENTDDLNPDWQEWIDESAANNKIHELAELQLAGADVYMSTFSQLKTFPFFQKIPHWFYPFDSQHPDLSSLAGKPDGRNISVFDLLINTGVFCNSDKYSFSFALLQMSERQKEYMRTQVGDQLNVPQDIQEQMKEIVHKKPHKEFISRQYIQDLYRFFKVWPKRHEMHDIFQDDLDLWKCETISQVLLHKEYINNLADYLFTYGYLKEAGTLYKRSIELYPWEDAELFQKAGYIYQKLGSYDVAIQYYLQADLLAPDNVWNNRHLAQCYKEEGEYEKAIEFYKRIEPIEPNNMHLGLQIGQCLIEMERYDEALTYFFKIEFLNKKPQNARRGIAWCSFITGKHQEAKKYYDLLIAEPHPIIEDWMNAGHVYYILGETSKAIEFYRNAQKLCQSHKDFVCLYKSDKEDLLKQGMNETDFYILPDILI